MRRLAALFLFVLVASTVPQLVRAAQHVLILTDNSTSSQNGSSHVAGLITAFTNAGATITTNSTELTNGSAMSLSLVTGWDDVIVVTVTGNPIDAGDVSVLQTAVNTRASSAFQFFTDACSGCTRPSAADALQIINAAAGWSATLGSAADVGYTGTLTGLYYAPFSALPTIQSTAYSPILGVPANNVIYTTNASGSPGPCAVVAPGSASSACVFLSTDVTQFWVAGGISATQANGLAAAYLNAASNCPLPSGPTFSLNITTVGGGTVSASPNQSVFFPGSIVQLTASPAAGFLSWSGDATGSTNPLSVTMNSNKNITASFNVTTLPGIGQLGGLLLCLSLLAVGVWLLRRRDRAPEES